MNYVKEKLKPQNKKRLGCLFVLPSVWLVFVFPSSGCPSADLLSIFASLSKPPGLCPLPASVETADGGNMTY